MRNDFIVFIKPIVLLFVIITTSCKERGLQEDGTLKKTISFIIQNKINETIDFPFLYDSLVYKIPDNSILKVEKILINKGFKKIRSGRGNHIRGPRIVIKTFKKEDCYCEVSKIYYSSQNSGYEITERIKCLLENSSDIANKIK